MIYTTFYPLLMHTTNQNLEESMRTYFSNLKKNLKFSNILMIFFMIYLPIFSFGIFAPTEIFFANHAAFGVIFAEFGWKFLGYGTLFAVILTLITLFLPNLLQKLLLSALWLISLGGYIQTMFLNKNLDQIGATTDGYIPETGVVIKNFLIWAVIIIIGTAIVIKSKDNWKKPVFLTSLILVATQGVAYSTLFLSAPADSMEYAESEYYLSGDKQYTVSSESNVIVFILDTISNEHYNITLQDYPELYDYFPDFTFYNNTDCNYYGTFPSIAHMLTGNAYNTTVSTNDWIYDCWNNETTTRYYDSMHEAGYKVNVFAVEPILFTTSHGLSVVDGKIDNLTSQSSDRHIDYDILYKTLLEMACYRFLPDYFKPHFDVPNTQYATIVTYPSNKINYINSDFYADLTEKGLSVNTEEKYVTFYHLNGVHELITDENCMRVEDTGSFATTIKGIWLMLNEYFNQLKELGVYDNSTIIITSDHGSEAHPQSIFFIKEANEHHEQMQVTNAPISLHELAPTIAQITTGESAYFGKTIFDFKENELRERTLYIRELDYALPLVKRFDGKDNAGSNCYYLYTYTGNYDDFLDIYWNGIFTVVPITDSYF